MLSFLENVRSEDTPIADRTANGYGIVFKLGGLYPNLNTPSYSMLNLIYFTVMSASYVFVAFLYGVTSYLSVTDLPILLQSFHFCSLNIVAAVWVLNFNMKRRSLARALHIVGTNLYDYDENTKTIRKNIQQSKIFLKKLAMITPQFYTIFVAGIIEMIFPLFRVITGKTYDKVYADNGISLNLDNPCWIPYGTDTEFTLYSTWIIKVVNAFGIAFVISSGCILIIEITQTVTVEIEVLIAVMQQLPQRTFAVYREKHGKFINRLSMLRGDRDLDLCYQYCLKQHVIHYQRIRRLFKDTQEVISIPLFCAYIMGAIVLALSASAVAFGHNELWITGTAVALGSGEVLFIFFFTWFGEQINSKSESLRIALYSTNWMYRSKESSVYIKVMQSITQRPLMLYAAGLWPVNYETFLNVVNTGYSYFNLVFASNNK